MYIKSIFFIISVLLLEGCSKSNFVMDKISSSTSCDRKVSPYSLDALDRDYSCQDKKIEGSS